MRLTWHTLPIFPMAHKHRNDGTLIPSDLEVEAATIGFRKVHLPELNATRWVVACEDCGTESSHGWPVATAPTVMIRNMRRIGWRIDKKHRKCPECIKKERPVKASAAPQIGPDPKIARKIYALLDEHFDEGKRLYRPGWTDAKIAETIDVSTEIVVHIRRIGYGELAEDPALQILRDDLEMLRMEAVELGNQFRIAVDAQMGKITELEARIANAPALRRAVC